MQDGAVVTRASRAAFDHCSFSDNGMLGLDVAGCGSRVTVSRCQVARNHQHGAAVCNGATLTLTGCAVEGNRCSGVHAVDAGTNLDVSDACVISGAGVAGASVGDGAVARLSDSEVTGNVVGLEASGRGAQVCGSPSAVFWGLLY